MSKRRLSACLANGNDIPSGLYSSTSCHDHQCSTLPLSSASKDSLQCQVSWSSITAMYPWHAKTLSRCLRDCP